MSGIRKPARAASPARLPTTLHPSRHPNSVLLLLLPLLLCLLLLPQPCLSVDPCANTTFSHSGYVDGVLYCNFYNYTLTTNESQNFVPSFQDPTAIITFTNVHLTVLNVSAPAYPYINQITLSLYWTAAIALVNTTLHAPYVWIYGGGSVNIHNTTHLSADGFAPSGMPTNPMPSQSNATAGTGGGGGGGGGIGGYGCNRAVARGGAATGDPVTPPSFSPLDCGGPGSVASGNGTEQSVGGFGFGGGFVHIEVGVRTAGDLTLAGTITSNGTDATHATLAAGGGAGGFVSLHAPSGRIIGADDGRVEANGGSGVNGGGGGAGGRIYIDGGIDSYTVRAYGGGSGSGGGCQAGGQGTIYSVTHNRTGNDTGYVELRCVGQDSNAVFAATDFSNSSTVDRLDLTYCNLIANLTVVISQQLTMVSSNLQTHEQTDGSGISSLHITVPVLSTSSGSSIAADRLLIEVDTLKLGSESTDKDHITFTYDWHHQCQHVHRRVGQAAGWSVATHQRRPDCRPCTAPLVQPACADACCARTLRWRQGRRWMGIRCPLWCRLWHRESCSCWAQCWLDTSVPTATARHRSLPSHPTPPAPLLPQTFSTTNPNWTPWSSLSISTADLTLGPAALTHR